MAAMTAMHRQRDSSQPQLQISPQQHEAAPGWGGQYNGAHGSFDHGHANTEGGSTLNIPRDQVENPNIDGVLHVRMALLASGEADM